MGILIAVVVTFIVTAGWHLLATRKIRANQQLMVKGIINELNEMAVKLGMRISWNTLLRPREKNTLW